jgi:hypothetical protein
MFLRLVNMPRIRLHGCPSLDTAIRPPCRKRRDTGGRRRETESQVCPRRARVATPSRRRLRVRRRNVPKDLRFSIGPDIKDALPGFSWSIWCLIAGWVCPLVSVSRIGYGVWSGEYVLLVVLMWWERWWCTVRLRRWGQPSAGSWQERAQCDLIGPTVFLLLHNLMFRIQQLLEY